MSNTTAPESDAFVKEALGILYKNILHGALNVIAAFAFDCVVVSSEIATLILKF